MLITGKRSWSIAKCYFHPRFHHSGHPRPSHVLFPREFVASERALAPVLRAQSPARALLADMLVCMCLLTFLKHFAPLGSGVLAATLVKVSRNPCWEDHGMGLSSFTSFGEIPDWNSSRIHHITFLAHPLTIFSFFLGGSRLVVPS